MPVKRASARMNAQPSRSGLAAPKPSNRAPAAGSKRQPSVAPASKTSGRQPQSASKSGISKTRPEPRQEEELPRGILAEPAEPDETLPSVPAAPRKKDSAAMRRAHPSSRSLKAASSAKTISNRSGGLNTSRDRDREKDQSRNSRREEKTSIRNNPNAGNNNMMIIGGVVGALALVLLIVVMSSSSKKAGLKPSGKQETQVIPGDPSSYLAKAREYEASGERLKAAQAYSDAADIYERQGKSDTAQQWSMKAYDIRKFTILDHGH